ncbi:MAG: hypothetical protein ACXVA2_24790 [Mucilaginibacter sp.]
MTRLPETITTKFVELFDAIHYATDDLKIAGAEANLNGDFSLVTELNSTCQKMQALEVDVKSLLSSFESKPKSRVTVKPILSNAANRTRKPSGHLRVRVAGKVIDERTAADTFVEVLKIFGFDRVAKLNKVMSGIPLFAKSPTTGYQTQKRIGNWYVTTHSNSQNKKEMLEAISKELRMPVQIEIVES